MKPSRSITALGRLILAAVALAVGAGPAAAQCRYQVTLVQGPGCPYGSSEKGVGINNLGDVVGHYRGCDHGDEAFSWTAAGGFVTLPRLYSARAFDVNDRGQIVGFVVEDDPFRHPALWENGELTDLGLLPGANQGQATAINSRGQIVGLSYDGNFGTPFDAFLWEDGEMVSLDPLLDARKSSASDINNHGQIVGWRRHQDGAERRAFLLDGETLIDLGGGFERSEAVAINDNGIVVGDQSAWLGLLRFVKNAVMWEDGVSVDLSVPPGTQGSRAIDINNAGEIIAESFGIGGGRFIIRRGEVLDLNTLLLDEGIVIVSLGAINDSGQITGKGGPANDVAILTPRSDPPGDLTCDETIDVADVVRLLGAWGQCGLCPADLNRDGRVDVSDIAELLSNWT